MRNLSKLATLALLYAAVVVAVAIPISAAETMPPAPKAYFNDFANVTEPAVREQLNAKLEQFERESSCQVVVAVFPKMQSDSSLEDYVNRMFRAWQIGQSRTNNGVLLAVFTQDRKMRIEVGYGLEGAIPDAIAKRIIAEEITPHFRAGEFTAGLAAGVDAILKAARGEYTGSGRTVADAASGQGKGAVLFSLVFGLIAFFVLVQTIRRSSQGTLYGPRRRHSSWGGFPVGGGWGGGGGGGWSGGGGGFSGGGGSSGGGGASGSW